jgi:predicted nucleotidyltransferase
MVKVSDKLINDMKDAIVREVDPEKIILFGSWALGQANEQSDVDLLVIEREPFGPHRSRRLEAARIWRCLSTFRVPKDILVYSSYELDQTPRVVTIALSQGKVLYESA